MRLGPVLSEAWRNLASGTTHAVLFCLISMFFITGACVLDLTSVTGILTKQREFRESGATVQVVSGSGGISADRCLSLTHIRGVSGAMAFRASPSSFDVSTLPSNPPPLFEATGDIDHFLPTPTPLDLETTAPAGVLLSGSLAERLGARAGSILALKSGSVVVINSFFWPPDGRASMLDGAAVAEVPASGRFEECWVDVWPPDKDTRALLLAATIPDPNVAQPPIIAQLNPSLGPGEETSNLLATRVTGALKYAAIPIAFGLGFVSTFIRRIEIASSLHAGGRRAQLTVQLALEATVWSTIAAIAAAAALLVITLRLATADDRLSVVGTQLIVVLAATAATVLGAIAGTTFVRAKHLFRYIKDR